MKPSIFDYENYKVFLSEFMSEESRGSLTRLAEVTRIHKSTLSQILRGSKHFTLEQGIRICHFLKLSTPETDYFLLLIELGRSGSHELTQALLRQMKERQREQRSVAKRVTATRELGGEEKAIYYSSWTYTAVKSLVAIPGFDTPAKIAAGLGIRTSHLEAVLGFLLQTGLIKLVNGKLRPGTQMTHLEAASPLVARHHGNWRVKAMERHPSLSDAEELAYTAPMTLSRKDAQRVRGLILELLEQTDRIVVPSPSEVAFCLNVDWFEVRREDL